MNIKCEKASNESRLFKEFPVELLLSVSETTTVSSKTPQICQDELHMLKNMTKFDIKRVFKTRPTHF